MLGLVGAVGLTNQPAYAGIGDFISNPRTDNSKERARAFAKLATPSTMRMEKADESGVEAIFDGDESKMARRREILRTMRKGTRRTDEDHNLDYTNNIVFNPTNTRIALRVHK